MEGGESAGYANLDDLLDDVAIVVAHITGIHLHVEITGICCQLDLQGSIGKLQRALNSATWLFRGQRF
jgi:hypothetical protein